MCGRPRNALILKVLQNVHVSLLAILTIAVQNAGLPARGSNAGTMSALRAVLLGYGSWQQRKRRSRYQIPTDVKQVSY